MMKMVFLIQLITKRLCNRLNVDMRMSEELEMQPCIF